MGSSGPAWAQGLDQCSGSEPVVSSRAEAKTGIAVCPGESPSLRQKCMSEK